jgi:type I restriction enzyme, S subunit
MKKESLSKNICVSAGETKNEEAGHALVPKLRFPEFRGPWEITPMGDKVDLLSGYSFDGTQISQDTSGVPILRGINITEGRIRHNPEIDRYYTGETEGLDKFRVRVNDLVIGMDGSKVGKNSALISNEDADALLIQRVARLRTISPVLIQFIFQQVNSINFHSYVDKINTSSGIPHISAKQIKDFTICFPSPTEQQKIAECLSSLDELIAAQARKVDALKTHKKGLMQQLFPREGETQPRLRFPEFRDAGEWRLETLGSLCARIMDGTHFSPKSKEGPRPYLTSKNIKDGRIDLSNLSYITEEEHTEIYNKCPVKPRDVLLTKDGANTGNCALNNLDFEFSLLSSVAVLRGHENKLCQDFLFQSILSDSIQSLITESMSGQAITRITLAKIGRFTISVTSPAEQQRIAECLSSLDDLIASETKKLDTLKIQKKGLMQQLFPSQENIEA